MTTPAQPAQLSADTLFNPSLIQRFDINGPRYTSYPTADRFNNHFTEKDALPAYQNIDILKPVSLYIHIPFCPNICYYCGCNKIITKDHGRSHKYIRYLAKEIALTLEKIKLPTGKKLQVSQLHLGGGTPTFLADEEIRELMATIDHYFERLTTGEYSIEIDPRRVEYKTLSLLKELGFNRISLGVQDFNEDVQKSVHRIQSEEETLAVLTWAKSLGFTSSSIDLIYGLPKQTPETFADTVSRVLQMNPDRLSVYSYAHLPHIFKPQRRINDIDLPSGAAKLNILAGTINRLTQAGYVFIGMDHFAKPDNELAVAQREGRLHRNFQGYSTYAECDMLAFGISSIGKIGNIYTQNVRTLDEYYHALDHHQLPVLRGITLNTDDMLRRELIGELMCHFSLDLNEIGERFNLDPIHYFSAELKELFDLAQTGLLTLSGENQLKINVTVAGRLLVRRVAMVFDRYLRESQHAQRYSKVL
jgi:oxygen-independent coproporphyrinogen III oxidase